MGEQQRIFGTPGGFIGRSKLRPLSFVLLGYLLFALVLSLFFSRVGIGGHVTSFWRLMVFTLLALIVSAYFQRPVLRRMNAWVVGRRGELNVARVVNPLADEGYNIIHDLDVGHGNVDHVIIGGAGVFAIETKAHRGRVYLRPGRILMCNNTDVTKWTKQALYGAMEIRRRVTEAGCPTFIRPVVALAVARLPKGPIEGFRHVTILEARDLPEWIRKHSSGLTDSAISEIRDALMAPR